MPDQPPSQPRSQPRFRALALARWVALATVLGLTLAACGAGDDGAGGDTGSDSGDLPGDDDGGDGGLARGPSRPSVVGPWILVALTAGGEPVDVPVGVELEMGIEGGVISGLAGCNWFSGGADAADDGTFTIVPLARTEMACDLLDFEQVYVGALEATDTWEVTPAGLTLRGDGVEVVYHPAGVAAPAALEGTVWTLDTVFGGEGAQRVASTPDTSRPPATLVISGGTATLSADDCGEVTFTLNHEGGMEGTLALPDPVDPGCDDAQSNLVTALDGITSASGYMVHERRLTFIGLPGETVAFTAIEG